jgi:hypothetical protein
MTCDHLTGILAERVMHWTVSPNRFMIDGRRWLPRWRFQPLERIAHADRLLEAVYPERYDINTDLSSII